MSRRDNHPQDTPKLPDTPYKGLMPYSEEDAPFFFGREVEREIITANLLASRLTLLYGACGVGKSSVLRAGVSYHLRQLAHQNLAERGTPEFVVVVFGSWRDDPVIGLKDRVQDAVAQALKAQVPTLEPMPPSLTVAQTLGAWAERVDANLLIILDQFEQYFLYHPQEDGEGTFATEFPQAVNSAELRASFLVSIREDSLAKLDRFKGRIPNLFDNYLRIEHLDREAARAAIEEPIEEYNRLRATEVRIEPALVEEVLNQVRTGQVFLGEVGRGVIRADTSLALAVERVEAPYLQLVMTRLWDEEMRAGSNKLQLATLERLGGAERIVRTHLDKTMSMLTLSEQKAATRIFHHLVTPSGAKIAHATRDLADYTRLPQAQVRPVLDKLSHPAVRILRTVAPPPDHPDAPRYEIYHDVLAPAILDWQARDREVRRLGLLKTMLLVATILAVLLIGIVIDQRQTARQQARLATSRQLAEQAQAALEVFPHRSLLLAIEALNVTSQVDEPPTQAAENALRQALANFGGHILDGHKDSITAVGISPDDRWLVTGSRDNTARLWDLTAPDPAAEPIVLPGHDGPITALAISPDNRWLATGSADATARLWHLTAPNPAAAPIILRAHKDSINTIAISPDSRWLVTGSADATARLWDLTAPDPAAEPIALRGHQDWILAVAISPDGHWLVTGSADATARLWDLTAPDPAAEPVILRGHESGIFYEREGITAVAFSPDNHWLVTGGRDRTARLWDLTTSDRVPQPVILRGHEDSITAVAISPDSHWLVTGSADATAHLWDLTASDPAGEPIALPGHEGSIIAVAVSPDSHWLVTGSADATARLWDLTAPDPAAAPIVFRGHDGSIMAVAASPNDRWIVTGSTDATARLWTLQLDELVELACRTAGRNLTRAEWEQYLGDEPYRATCPDLPAGEELMLALQINIEAFSIIKEGNQTALIKPGTRIAVGVEEIVRVKVEVSTDYPGQEKALSFAWYTCYEGDNPVLQRIGNSEMFYVAPSRPGTDCIVAVIEKGEVQLDRGGIFVDVQKQP